METTIKQRIIEYLRYVKIGQNKFEKMAGISNGYISNLKKNPSPEKIQQILTAAPELNRDWLLFGEGDMLKPEKREMETTVKERIKEFIKYKGIGQAKFEKLCNLSNGYINNLKRSPTTERIQNILCTFPEINKIWLLTGEGDMLKPEKRGMEGNAEMMGRAFHASTPDEGVVNVRYFSVTPTATFQEFCDEESGEPEYMPVIPPGGERIDESSCVFQIHGESMAPMIPNHAKVLCREIRPSRWHDITSGVIVIAYRDRFVIKRIVKNRLASEDYLIITSDNPDYCGDEKVARADIRCIFQARQVLSYPVR